MVVIVSKSGSKEVVVVRPPLSAGVAPAPVSARYCVRAYRTSLRVQGAVARPPGQLLLQRILVAWGGFDCVIAASDVS